MSNCLVIVDVQRGFLSDLTNQVPKKLNELVSHRHFDHIVATQFKNAPESPYERFLGWKDLEDAEQQTLDPFVASVTERVFPKNGYSCFTDEFVDFLKSNGIDELYIAGIDTDCCVLTSAIEAFERNIQAHVILSCCASNGGEKSHDAAILVLERCVGEGFLER